MRRAAALIALLAAAAPRADPFPARGGESGILDVPDSEVLELGAASIGGELRVRERRDPADSTSPVRFAVVTGLGHRLELGASMREDGLPGDPRSSAALFGAAIKLRLLGEGRLHPALALDASVDRINAVQVGAARLIASIRRGGPLRITGFVSGQSTQLGRRPEAGAGVAAALRFGRAELVAELLGGPGGRLSAGALRWYLTQTFGVSVGSGYLDRTGELSGSIGVAVAAAMPRAPRRRTSQELAPAPAPAPEPPPQGKRFPTDRPRFPVKSGRVAPEPEGAR